jgi:heme-degrading monooxygenase HmoA
MIFHNSKEQIAAFPGCSGLQLLRDANKNHVYFTYSHWENEDALNNYRHSALFTTVWAQTKALFNDKPQAWSTIVEEKVK